MELGALEGVICGLALGAMGIMTAFLVLIVKKLLDLPQQHPAKPPTFGSSHHTPPSQYCRTNTYAKCTYSNKVLLYL